MMKTLPSYLKNRYVIGFLVFFIWLLFFDRNSLINQYRLISSVNDLENEQDYYQSEIEKDSIALKTILSNKEELEKYAREKYMMKKDDEDVYVIVRK